MVLGKEVETTLGGHATALDRGNFVMGVTHDVGHRPFAEIGRVLRLCRQADELTDILLRELEVIIVVSEHFECLLDEFSVIGRVFPAVSAHDFAVLATLVFVERRCRVSGRPLQTAVSLAFALPPLLVLVTQIVCRPHRVGMNLLVTVFAIAAGSIVLFTDAVVPLGVDCPYTDGTAIEAEAIHAVLADQVCAGTLDNVRREGLLLATEDAVVRRRCGWFGLLIASFHIYDVTSWDFLEVARWKQVHRVDL